MNERLLITIIAVLLAFGTYLYILQVLTPSWRSVGISNLILTGGLLLYYRHFVFDPSHGIGILILPMFTCWFAWRQENTGKPGISPKMFILLQIVLSLLFIAVVRLQEG